MGKLWVLLVRIPLFAPSQALTPIASTNRLWGMIDMRSIRTLVGIAVLACLGGPAWAESPAAHQVSVDIPAQPVAKALNAFAQQTGMQLLFRTGAVKDGAMAPRLVGSFTAEEALAKLLEATELEYKFLDDRTIAIRVAREAKPAAAVEGTEVPSVGSERLRLAEAEVAPGAPAAAIAEDLEEITITSTRMLISVGKTPASVRETPQSVSIITRQRIEDQNLSNLEDALLESPGLTMQRSSSGQESFFSRGYFLSTIQLDGVPTEVNPWTVFTPDLAMYDRVEVLRGADGLYTGAGSPSGTVNLVRKRPLRRFQMSMGGEAGSDSQYRAEFDITGPLSTSSDRLRSRLVAAYDDREFFYDFGEKQNTSVYGVLAYDLTSTTTVSTGFNYQDTDLVPYTYQMPRFSDGRDLGLPRSTFLNAAWNRQHFKGSTSHVELEQRIGAAWIARLTATRVSAHNDLKNGYVWGSVDPQTLLGPGFEAYLSRYKDEQSGFELLLSGGVDLFGRTHDLQIGANWQKHEWRYEDNYLDTGFPAVDVFNWDPSAVPEPFDVLEQYLSRRELRQHGIFGKARFRLSDGFSLIGGGRVSWYDFDEQDLLSDWSNNVKQNGQFTPFGAVVWDFSEAWSAYASLARIFQPQSDLRSFSGGSLPPKFGTNLEIGLKSELLQGKLTTSLALFRIDETNRPQSDVEHPPTGGIEYFVAQGKIRSEGFEAEMGGALTTAWTLFASYTYNTTEYLRDQVFEGQTFATFTPKHLAKVWTNYRLPFAGGRWNVGGGLSAQSGRYNIEDWNDNVRIEQGGYSVVSLHGGYRITEDWRASLHVNNLFDKKYYDAVGYTDSNNAYGAPRSVVLSVRGKF